MGQTTDDLREPGRVASVDRYAGDDPATRRALDELAALTADLLAVPVVLVSLVDDSRQLFRGMCGLPDPWASRRQTGFSHSFCKLVAASGEPLVIEDARTDPRVSGNLAVDALRVVAYAGHPLTDAAGRVLGSFCAIDGEPRSWSAEDRQVLARCARMAEATLFAAAEQGRGGLDEAEGMSRRLQRALLPARLSPRLSDVVSIAYQPGSQRMLLGGDFVDVFDHEDGSIGFVLGDVCGHGPEAAALAIELRATWSAIEAERRSLAVLAQRMDDTAWRRNRESHLFATAVFGRIAPDRRSGQAVRAGHEHPLALDPTPRAVSLPDGLGLGMVEGQRWRAGSFGIGPRGLLVHTDGLTDGYASPARHGERFGPQRLAAAARAHAEEGREAERLVDRLLRDATAAHGDELVDDVAIVHIRGADTESGRTGTAMGGPSDMAPMQLVAGQATILDAA